MKTLTAFILATLFFLPTIYAQEEQEMKSLFKNVEAKYVTSDIYFYSLNYNGDPMAGGGFNLSAVFNNNVTVGMGFDVSGTKNVNFQNLTPATNPRLTLWGITANAEYLFMPNKIVNFSIPIKIGLGYATYKDRYIIESSNYYNNNYRLIEDDYYFIAEPGINMFVNIFDWMSIKVGGSYRFISGASELGSNAAFSGLALNTGIRFKIFEE